MNKSFSKKVYEMPCCEVSEALQQEIVCVSGGVTAEQFNETTDVVW